LKSNHASISGSIQTLYLLKIDNKCLNSSKTNNVIAKGIKRENGELKKIFGHGTKTAYSFVRIERNVSNLALKYAILDVWLVK
jgi:hypothetical protein